MKQNLNWKKAFFKTTIEIFNFSIPAGKLKPRIWTNSADGELNGKKFIFKTEGFFRRKTLVIDAAKNSQVALISFNSWRKTARIENSGKLINFKFINFWNTKWNLSDDNGILVSYKGNTIKGDIETNNQNDMLILSGLFIASYFRKHNGSAAS